MSEVTWTCHVCGCRRPDYLISVYSRQIRIGRVPVKENVRYCNDREECIAAAPAVRFFKG